MSEVKEHLSIVRGHVYKALKEVSLVTENHCSDQRNFAPALEIEEALNIVLRKVEAAEGLAEVFESNPEHGRL